MSLSQTVTIAQALASAASALQVVDTAANIAGALPNAGLVARVASFTLSADTVIAAAMAAKLASLGGKFHAGLAAITIQDSVAGMTLAANAAGLALATSRQIVDVAYNLLAAAPGVFTHVASVTLTGAPTLSMIQLGRLENLPGFSVASGAHLALQDALSAFIPIMSAHPAWFAAASSLQVRLDGSQIGAAGVASLAAMAVAGKTVSFIAGLTDSTLNVTASAHDLANDATALNRLAGLTALHITVSNEGAVLTAADAVALTGIAGFAPGAHILSVADTGAALTAVAAALFSHGFTAITVTSGVLTASAAQLLDTSLHVQGLASVVMTGSAMLTAAQTQALTALPGFSLAHTATLTVSDTAAHLIDAAVAAASATAVAVAADAIVSAAGLTTLAALASSHPGNFSLGGHSLTVTDTAAALLALQGPAVALATGFTLSADATVNAAQAQMLAAEPGFALGGHQLTVLDTAGALLLLPQGLQTLSGHLLLAGDQTVSTVQLTGLAALGGIFGTGGHVLGVTGSAAALLALAPPATALAASFTLNADATVTEMQFLALRDGLAVSTGGHAVTIADTAADLLALSGSLALDSATTLTADATVTAAQAVTLGNDPNFGTGGHALAITGDAAALLALPQAMQILSGHLILAADQTVSAVQAAGLAALGESFFNGGHAVTVVDTAAALLALPLGVNGLASGYGLSADATVTAAQFAALRDTLHVAPDGHTITILDSAAHLLGLSGSLSLANACVLSADATVNAAQAQMLAAEPGFALGGHQLTVLDTAGALLLLPQGLQTLSGHLLLAGDQTVSTVQLTGLAALGGIFGTGGHVLGVTGSAAALLALAPPATALAASFTLNADATVTEMQFLALRDGLAVSTGGHAVTIADTAADLLALSGSLALDSATTLTADATVTAAQAVTLGNDPNFGTGGHALAITGDAAALLALPQAMQILSGHLILAADQTVSAVQAAGLAALGESFFNGGHAVTVVDTAAALLALPVGVNGLASGYGLSADATVTAAQFAALRDTLHVAPDGHTITILDSAAHLLGLSGSLSLANACVLTADASVSASSAMVLAAEPGFSTGGHALTVADNAANLLALPVPLQTLASSLTLGADQQVSAVQLAGLVGLGVKFSAGGHALTIAGTAADLAALTVPELALASGEVLSQSATVSAALAQTLVRLPAFSLGQGAALTVQDSAANLLLLSGSVLAVAAAEQLPPGLATLSAVQAAGLAAMMRFSTAGATITVQDDVASLTAAGNVGWHNIAAAVHVVDIAATLAANASSPLLQQADLVSLSFNATIGAAQASQIASIPHFSTILSALTVSDGAAAIVANEAAILRIATTAVVTDSGPLTAAQADTLALLSAASKLVFQGGNQLEVADSYAALVSGANATGLALAGNITVIDGGAALAAAAAHNWGSKSPTYVLSDDPVLTGPQATALAGLGAHFVSNGHQMSVLDNAAGVAAAAPALASLAITAIVLDSVAGVTAHSAALQALGNALSAVEISDVAAVSGSVAAALQPFATKLSGQPVTVLDTAAGIEGNLAALISLAGHAAITVHDGAAAIGADALDLTALGSALTVVLTDQSAVGASVAASLVPLTLRMAPDTSLNVTDTAANVTAVSASLAALSGVLGLLTLSGGTAVSVAQADALLRLDSHLGGGVRLAVSGTAAEIAASRNQLLDLQDDGRAAGVSDLGDTAQAVTAAVSALNQVGVTVTVSDTQSHVQDLIAGLGQVFGLTAITVTDALHPIFAATVSQYADESRVLGLVTNVHTIAIADSAAAIAADLGGGTSVIEGILGPLTIATLGGAALVLSQDVALSAPVAAVLSNLVDPLQVSGVDLAHLSAALALSPQSVTVLDTASNIQADLASGSPALVSDLLLISSITVSDGGAITLTVAQALAAGVDDAAGSVFGLLHGGALAVTDAAVADVAGLLALQVAPATITVSDSAAAITDAIRDPTSAIMTAPGTIIALAVNDGQSVILTEAQDLAAGVNDSTQAAAAKLSDTSLVVTGVAVADLAQVEGGARTPDMIRVVDTAAHIASALPALLNDLRNLGAITVSSGLVTLTAAQALTAHVADGPGSLALLLPGQAFAVTGATMAQVPSLAALAVTPVSIAVTDSSAVLAADIASPLSQWAAEVTHVTVIGGVLTLTDAQASALGGFGHTANLHALVSGQTVDIIGVPLADATGFAAYAASLSAGVVLQMDIADTAVALAADLSSQTPVLTQIGSQANSITLTAAGGTLDAADLTAVAAIAGLQANDVLVPVTDGAAAIAGLGIGARELAGAVTVLDSATNVTAELGVLQAAYDGQLTITLTGPSPSITVSAANYAADFHTIAAISNPGCVTVTGNATDIAALEPMLLRDVHVAQVQITDSATGVLNNLSAIEALGGVVTITLNDVGTIAASLALTLITQDLPHLSFGGLIVADSGAQIAAMAEASPAALAFLTAQGAQLTADGTVSLVDAAALSGLGGAFDLHGHTLAVWDTASHLTQPGAAAALAALIGANLVTGAYLRTSGGAVTLSAAGAATLLGIAGLSINNPDTSVNVLTVADTAAHLETAFVALQGELGQVSHVVVSASGTVSAGVLYDLQALGAVTGAGVALTVADNAANIITASGVSGASVQASAWVLNASASVSAANAILLASLPSFSAGGHSLIVALAADTPLSVSQANNLAALSTALVVTGHEFTVSGSAASLAGLSAAGAQVAHVALTDTLAHIAGLGSTSPLLTGSITVSDSESLAAADAAGFLTLIGAAGVNGAAILFGGHTETVTDTVANLRALASSDAWIGNAALVAHFALVADDNAAALGSAGNAAFLNTLSGQVLSATSNVTAATASALSALTHFSLGGHGLIVSDTATNLLAAGNASGVALATSVTLNGAATLAAADTENLLQLSNFHLTQALTVTDNSANLLDGALSGVIAGHNQVTVTLAGAETLDAQTASALVSLQGFADTADMHIVDSSSYLLAAGATAAELMAASVSLDGNETVSANTILRLSEVPHFISGGGTLSLAGSDFANALTQKAIADLGTNFSEAGHSLSLTQDNLGLTPTELAALHQDGFNANGHVISAILVNDLITDTGNVLSLSATGVAGAAVNIYDAAGGLISTTQELNASFTITAPDTGSGHAFSITETVAGVESAPVVVLEAGALESAVNGASALFANSGQIQVDTGKYINLYTAGALLPNAPSLVYDPGTHTISLDIPNNAPVTLITLGAATTPASLDATEILVKHHG